MAGERDHPKPPARSVQFNRAVDDLMGKKYGRGYIYYGEPDRLKTDPVQDDELAQDELLKENAILVVGGTGRTGQWITLGLLNQGFNVRVLTRRFENSEKLFGPSGSNVRTTCHMAPQQLILVSIVVGIFYYVDLRNSSPPLSRQ
jgi:hypothetical protein